MSTGHRGMSGLLGQVWGLGPGGPGNARLEYADTLIRPEE